MAFYLCRQSVWVYKKWYALFIHYILAQTNFKNRITILFCIISQLQHKSVRVVKKVH